MVKQENKLMNGIKWIWDLIVIFAKVKLSMFILVSCIVTWVLAIMVLDEAGTDITIIGKGIQITINFAIAYLVIIFIDWIIKLGKEDKDKKKIKEKEFCDKCGFEFTKKFFTRKYEIFYNKNKKRYCFGCNIIKFRSQKGNKTK